MGEQLEKVKTSMAELDLDAIAPAVQSALDAGEEPSMILANMADGMAAVGELFEKGEYFLADLVLAGEGMKEGLEVLEPHLKAGDRGGRGTVVLCTVKGDIHDIGKNLVATMLSSAGYKVVDLGTDVHEDKIVEAVRANQAGAVGLSVLLTPMVESIREVVNALEAAGLRDQVKIVIGGGPVNQAVVDYAGADAWGKDPGEALRLAEQHS